jgi:hypothetical protein
MTYRERREARAAQLREWADKRETKATADLDRGREMLDAIPFGQPMLADHYSYGRDRRYRDRAVGTLDRGMAHARKADEMRSKAANIEAAADAAIYSDDPDAIERLESKLADLEAQRDRIKRYNASCRKGERDLSILDECQQRKLLSAANAGQVRENGAMPAYALSNLSGAIKATRDRLARLNA